MSMGLSSGIDMVMDSCMSSNKDISLNKDMHGQGTSMASGMPEVALMTSREHGIRGHIDSNKNKTPYNKISAIIHFVFNCIKHVVN